MQFDVIPYGEQALLINFKEEISLEIHQQVKACFLHLRSLEIVGITDFIPAYHSLTICFNSLIISFLELKQIIMNTEFKVATENSKKNIIEIPVCYDVDFGLDLNIVAQKTGLSSQEIIRIHTEKPYLVYMLGFAPGFMYLGGLDKRIQVPRKENPRLKIAAGAVGLADQQTGIYPLETPGGWQIIGQTPLSLFSKEKPSLVAMGDHVQFVPISKEMFFKIKET